MSTCDVSWTGFSLVDFVGTSAKQKEPQEILTFPKIIKICQKIKNHAEYYVLIKTIFEFTTNAAQRIEVHL